MTEHNHRRPSKRRGPKVKIVTETITKSPGVTYRFGRHSEVKSDVDGVLTYEHVVADGHYKGSLPTRPWRPKENVGKGASDVGPLSGVSVGARSGYEHSNGHRGQAKAARGAKKFVRTRIRFHENAATRRLAQQAQAGLAD
ncbi:hypothetical protein [Rhizobium leguminosarum]|uniref:hypothetical protein n=1 Tax=Rhizobium leguminosarum TaxID=384 RepID=UPI002E115DA6|nr:hypothetical protein U8Q02_40710 [Rhizobium leguminosarum]